MKAICQNINLRLFCWEMSTKDFSRCIFDKYSTNSFFFGIHANNVPLKKSQIYFGELFYGMFPTTIPLFIDCFIFSTKHIRPGICWKFLKVLFENGRCSFWVIPPGICWKISRQSLWRENLEGVKLFV